MAKFSILQFWREQRAALPLPKAVVDVGSMTLLVTGSNVGLGLEASVHLAEMRPRLLLATSRDMVKCEQTREVILQRATADSGAVPEVAAWPLDLSTFENVRTFVDKFEAEGDCQLNVLVANAGIFKQEYTKSQDGWEVMLQINYLSTALLSILLLPYLVNSSKTDSPSRLVIVSSLGHYLASPKLKEAEKWTCILDTMNDELFCALLTWSTSGQITLVFGLIFVRELAARLPNPAPVVACAVNPGFCSSSLFRDPESKWYMHAILSGIKSAFFARSPEEGSRTLVHAAVASEEHSMHGRYLSNCQITEEDDYLFTPEGRAFSIRLWTETIQVLSKVDVRISEIVNQHLQAAQ
ncbi:hypothetical protein HYDPIDRAFT_93647 [Hydnomerulius pinastri MD-312]|uniref:Uncharacterized protein n=1 Tax=Hydnomerulius pinastri MD-312 TaxID=994086 RepID=A0A0C9WDW0_9AGAM|nr:hypothetical protein HYDPIDRAFT_93647 [Hydnomerulius pinastri MD-312]